MTKISTIAKDFNLKTKEVVALLKEHGIEKSVSGSLEDTEYELFFECLMLANQIENLDEYVAGKATLVSEKPKEAPPVVAAAPVKETTPPKTVEAPAPKPQNPTVTAAPFTPVAKPTQKRNDEPRYTVPGNRRPQNNNSPDRRSGNTQPQKKQVDQAELQRRMEQFRADQAVVNQQRQAKEQEMRAARQVAAQEAEAKKPQAPAQPKKDFKPIAKKEPVDRFSNRPMANQSKAQKPQKDEKKDERTSNRIILTGGGSDEGTELANAANKVRVVDTRTTQVDLSRYDERIDSRYASGQNDLQTNRQKLKKQDTRMQGKAAKEKERAAQERIKRMQAELARKKQLEITVPDTISVGELSIRMKKTSGEVMKKLMMMGVMASVNQEIDYDTAFLIAEEFNVKVTKEVVVTIEERLFDEGTDAEENLQERSPVVCVMGHVDHGKTSLLDAIRHTSVTKGEAGGITQHIGAYRTTVNGKEITFLDTPGHEAFTSMRARGAQATDIAILVVAADDGIMPQTVEAINHAKAAGIDIIVAINKMDKPQANPDAVMQTLTQYDLVPEEWGGDVICVPVSAMTGMGIDKLLETVLLVAEVKELKANPNRRAKGLIIESRLDKGRGPVATILVQTGTLRAGDVVIAGTAVGRVRAMKDEHGQQLTEAGPSVPVEVTGLSEVPGVGDEFNAVEDEKMARDLAEQRREKAKQEEFKATARVNLDELFAQLSDGVKTLNVIVKADVGGSAEAVKQSLLKLSGEEVKVSVIHTAVGGITESDVMLASASNAIIVGFNVRPDKTALDSAERQGVDIRTYRIIYDCINEIEAAMKGMLAPKYKEVLLGHAEVRQVIRVPKVGAIAGCYVLDGKIARHAKIRIVRDGILICEDEIASLKRFKDDAKEVATGYECGVGLENFNDIKEGDSFEAFIMEEISR